MPKLNTPLWQGLDTFYVREVLDVRDKATFETSEAYDSQTERSEDCCGQVAGLIAPAGSYPERDILAEDPVRFDRFGSDLMCSCRKISI
jgi:hypothetical protein